MFCLLAKDKGSNGYMPTTSTMSDVSSRKSRLTVPSGGGTVSERTSAATNSINATGSTNSSSGMIMTDYGGSSGSSPNNHKALLSNPLLPSISMTNNTGGLAASTSSTLPSIVSPVGSYHRSVYSSSSYYGGHHPSSSSASSSTAHHHNHSNNPMIQYIHRFMDISQMDIQNALDQMTTLISSRPQLVYKTSYYRKQTKNHWYRDDPAFIVLQLLFLFIACLAYNIAFRTNIITSISFILYSIVWNYLLLGIIISTVCREIANRHLNIHHNKGQHYSSSAYSHPSSSSPPPSATMMTGATNAATATATTTASLHVKQQVEWLYSFDIHCNSFFPVFVVLYGLQFFALPIALGEGFIDMFIANTLYAGALSWYWYITHLGYRSLPFLSNTEVFLFPIAGIMIVYVLLLIGYPFHFGYNISRVMARFYFP